MDAGPETRFVFPEAPLSLAGMMPAPVDMRAWWMIDVVRLQEAVTRGEFRDLRGEVPPGLAEARGKLVETLDAIEADLRPSKLVLGGFRKERWSVWTSRCKPTAPSRG